ncbi:MAG: response regulator [Verrucomicrobiales bacterium]
MANTKIMLVDDEVGFTNLLRMNLEKAGTFEVAVENDASNALKSIRDFEPDVLLLDVVMPGMDGGDIVAQLRMDPRLKTLPIIMLTALISKDEISSDAVAQSENLVMIAKPVNMEMLQRVIEEALAG